jgi:Uma2 family endonuclease
MSIHEIVLPETKPETEWVRGRALQKVSPTYDHGKLQSLLTTELTAWADRGARGRVATEWRFRIAPPGAIVRPLIPDVAFLSYEALPADAERSSYQTPLVPPTVAVEILSPDDRPADIEDKISTYLAAGSVAVIVVDPRHESIAVYDRAGMRVLRGDEVLRHDALPDFALGIGALFARARGRTPE